MASKTALTAFVFILIISRLSMADPIVQKQTFGGTPNISGVLAFNQFDESVGNLTSIQITLFLQSSGGRLILDNDNEYPVSGTLEFGAKGIISSTDVSLVNASSAYIPGEVGAYHSGTFNLAGNVGDVEGDYDPNAPDGLEYNGGIETDSKSDFVGEFAWDGYKGSGTYDIKSVLSR
ncbi:MAG: hypothetical protein CVV39_08610 [Planctomycetes bacterium HGW-Planctomycetes-1]|nr:MAG: hypothetical protein CVV39_08610 [Planctomycetes bacterium HGW-Planctomycetes-1]